MKISVWITLVYVGNWAGSPVYVNPEMVQGIVAVHPWEPCVSIKLSTGNEVCTKWSPEQIKQALEKAGK